MTWEEEKSCPYRDSNSDLSAVQPIARRYIDGADCKGEKSLYLLEI
jgi:hypothetical protein